MVNKNRGKFKVI